MAENKFNQVELDDEQLDEVAGGVQKHVATGEVADDMKNPLGSLI